MNALPRRDVLRGLGIAIALTGLRINANRIKKNAKRDNQASRMRFTQLRHESGRLLPD